MKATILAAVVLAFSVSQASAVSHAVKMACAADYFAHCSMHAVGSPGVRKCMRAVGPRLSTRCIDALIAAGEVKSKVATKKKGSVKQYAAKRSVSKKLVAERRVSKKKLAEKLQSKKAVSSETRVPKREYADKPSAKKRYSKKQLARKYLAQG
jgi:hypothetical protein